MFTNEGNQRACVSKGIMESHVKRGYNGTSLKDRNLSPLGDVVLIQIGKPHHFNEHWLLGLNYSVFSSWKQ